MVKQHPANPSQLSTRPEGKLNLNHTVSFKEHRSGWGYCMSSIAELHHDNGVYLDDFIEKSFSWDLDLNLTTGHLPYTQPWVGILHNPPAMPSWYFYQDSPQIILEKPAFQKSLQFCRGLYVLSEYHQKWLSPRVNVPVEVLTHPTETPEELFTLEKFNKNANKAIINVGIWLRSLVNFSQLKISGYSKIWLVTNKDTQRHYDMECLHLGLSTQQSEMHDVEKIPWVENSRYDSLLSENLVFVYLYDSSANNVVIECIVRNTPILINPLPAVIEYLGADYPFYYSTFQEARSKAEDISQIVAAYEYLKALDKIRFSGPRFLATLRNSKIYQALPVAEDNFGYLVRNDKVNKFATGGSLDCWMRYVREQLEADAADKSGMDQGLGSLEHRVLSLMERDITRDKMNI